MRINIKMPLIAFVLITLSSAQPAVGNIQYYPGAGRPANPVGKNFADDSEMGFEEYVGGVMLMRDYRPGKWDDELEEFPEISDSGICLTFVSTDSQSPRDAKYLHIFLTRKIIPGQRPFVVHDELDIYRKSNYEYIHEDVRYEFGGREFYHSALVCYDPEKDAIVKWYPIDVENLRFISADPLPGMEVVWQEP